MSWAGFEWGVHRLLDHLATCAARAADQPIGEQVLLTAGACAGIGFTVSLLGFEGSRFSGTALDEARLGALCTVVVAPARKGHGP